MSDIPIELLVPTSNPSPSNGVDSGGGAYTAWALNEEAEFDFPVSELYQTGTDLSVSFQGASSGTALNHKWKFQVSLNGDTAQVFTAEFTSSSSANQRISRAINISSSGTIHGVAISRGDTVSVILTRIAADSNEDSNEIKIYDLVAHGIDMSSYGGFVVGERTYQTYMAGKAFLIGGVRIFVDGSPIGNGLEAKYAPKRVVLEKKDFTGGVAGIGEMVVSEIGCEGSFVTDYITAVNLAMFTADHHVSFHTLELVGIYQNSLPLSYYWNSVYIQSRGEHDLRSNDFQKLPFTFKATKANGNDGMPVIRQVVSTTSTTSTTSTSTTSTTSTSTSTTT